MSYQPIENYGIIGNLNTVALVGIDGSIDSMCFPHFDSPSIFAALLDDQNGGRFRLAPVMEDARHKQIYLPDTNILLTRFLAEEGVAEVSDFMPVDTGENGSRHQLIRRAKSVHGEMEFDVLFAPAFDYARAEHKIEKMGDGSLIFESQGDDRSVVRLRANIPLEVRNGAARARFKLSAGHAATFIMEDAHLESQSIGEAHAAEAFKETMNFWRKWMRHSTYKGRWREMVNRSALTLKLLTSSTYGSIVAAPTFSLPEEIGGGRNWDYRYSWIRDSAFTLYALMRLGYTSEAKSFMNWIEDRCQECDHGETPLNIMYRLDGSAELHEVELGHLEGYRRSSPVRIGNGAVHQLQLDIYGELMDSVYIYNKYSEGISYDFWQNLSRMVDWVCENWARPDEGIWEIRGPQREFLYSRVMCWVAIDRAIRLAGKRSFPAPLEKWHHHRDAIYRDIYENFWDEELKSFVQSKGSKSVDASCLLMPLVRFTGPTDPRWTSTLRAIEKSLVEDALVFRYNIADAAPDGLAGGEGAFTMCSFWLVECISRGGDIDRARFIFEKALGYANHLGLYSEELGAKGEHLGNFPQAFTHLSLISSAFNLNEKLTARL
ncbi:MAG: glycoside hydrolase family 15 protein [Chthoniobacteraceae bacterium]